MVKYAVEFGTLLAESGWNESALQSAFSQGPPQGRVCTVARRDITSRAARCGQKSRLVSACRSSGENDLFQPISFTSDSYWHFVVHTRDVASLVVSGFR